MDIIAAAASEGAIPAGRFILRPVRTSDAGLFMLYAGDRRVAEATRSIPHPLPPGAAEAFVARAMRTGGDEDIWAMDGLASGLPEVLGVISLRRMDRQAARAQGRPAGGASDRRAERGAERSAERGAERGGQSEIGYWVAPAFWNLGIASQAVQALVAANPQGCRTIFAEVFQDNPGSARVLTNAGFDYLGDAEGFSVARNARVPTWTYLRRLG